MSELEDAESKVQAWLQPLPDQAAPCGPDLEYDNDFLALTQAAQGKPEDHIGKTPAQPPDWRAVVELAERLFGRTRDLRVAIQWLRAELHLQGYAALAVGLRLFAGMIDSLWEHVHPLPDPDDGVPYGRIDAITLLREQAGLLGDLLEARLIDDRNIGMLLVRDVGAALGHAAVGHGRSEITTEQARRMLELAAAKNPALRAQCEAAVAQVQALIARVKDADRLGSGAAPDLQPLYTLVKDVAKMLPEEAAVAGDGATAEAAPAAAEPSGARGGQQSLAGAVNSRDDAVRAIDLVVAYLERAEPSNPAPLFLRRARQLIDQNFLQLVKALAPDALAEVARVVGVDPASVDVPGAGP